MINTHCCILDFLFENRYYTFSIVRINSTREASLSEKWKCLRSNYDQKWSEAIRVGYIFENTDNDLV